MNLNDLPDEVLLYANDQFYQFIENCLGVDEMNLLKIQSIRNTRTLLKVSDVFSVFNIKCKEIIGLRNRLCFIDEDSNNTIIKAGVKTDFDDLIAILKEKNCKYLKGLKKSNLSSSSTNNSRISNASSFNTTTSSIIDSSLPSTPSKASNVMSLDDYVQTIISSIENYSIKTFENIILKHDDDYTIHLNQSNANINGHIKCGCKSTIKLAFRFRTNSFQLSQYFKHVKHSRCSMMKRKRQASRKSNHSSYDIKQNNILSDVDERIDSEEENTVDLNEGLPVTTNGSLSTDSNSLNKKRKTSALQDTTKKTKQS